MNVLEIKNLAVSIDRPILNGVNLSIKEGEVHVIMGPNASGKTTLIMALLGYPNYKIDRGEIRLLGKNLNELPTYERIKLGLAISFQAPPEIRGVKLRDIIRLSGGKPPWDPFKEPAEDFASPILEKVGLDPAVFRDRDVNVGFSGGEKKRSELAQIFAAKPKLLILDEPDSGVDIDSLKTIGNDLSAYIRENRCSCLIVTHYRHILPYIKPDMAHIMCAGVIVKTGEPMELFTRIEEKGYCEYLQLCPPGIKEAIERRE